MKTEVRDLLLVVFVLICLTTYSLIKINNEMYNDGRYVSKVDNVVVDRIDKSSHQVTIRYRVWSNNDKSDELKNKDFYFYCYGKNGEKPISINYDNSSDVLLKGKENVFITTVTNDEYFEYSACKIYFINHLHN